MSVVDFLETILTEVGLDLAFVQCRTHLPNAGGVLELWNAKSVPETIDFSGSWHLRSSSSSTSSIFPSLGHREGFQICTQGGADSTRVPWNVSYT